MHETPAYVHYTRTKVTSIHINPTLKFIRHFDVCDLSCHIAEDIDVGGLTPVYKTTGCYASEHHHRHVDSRPM